MAESKQSRKHSLEYLRLEAECRYLAGNAPKPDVRSHFLRMAETWASLAVPESGCAEPRMS